MKCNHKGCKERVEYYEEDNEGGWCDNHIKDRAPEYIVDCPKCDITICVN